MPIRGRVQAAGLAAVVAAGVTGCTGPVSNGAQDTASPAPRATTVAPARSPRSPGAASLGAAAAPRCRRRQLEIRIVHGGPAAGTVGADIGFTNDGSTPCRLAGWLALMAVGPAGRAAARRTLVVFAGPGAHPAACGDGQPGRTGRGGPGWPGRTRAWRHHMPSALPPAARHAARGHPGHSHLGLDSLVRDVPACGRIEISPVVPARIGWPGGEDQH